MFEEKQIYIILTENGKLEINGEVLKDEPLALWMLEKAKDGIKKMHTPAPKLTAPGSILNFARGRK